jgi:hypothetical protein
MPGVNHRLTIFWKSALLREELLGKRPPFRAEGGRFSLPGQPNVAPSATPRRCRWSGSVLEQEATAAGRGQTPDAGTGEGTRAGLTEVGRGEGRQAEAAEAETPVQFIAHSPVGRFVCQCVSGYSSETRLSQGGLVRLTGLHLC